MATQEKTIEFAWDTYTTDVADITTATLAQISLYIPETVIAFTSVFAEFGYQDAITATGGTVTEHRLGLRLGAAAYTTVSETDDIANSGENMSGVMGPYDFTSHFTTNWTGTSMTCDAQVYIDFSTGTTLVARNITVKLYVTYTYDDNPATNATQIKTVRIPLESLVGALSTTANSNIGSSQIPALNTFLAEQSVTIRDYFFEIEGNVANNNTTTDFTISANVDAGTAKTFAVTEAALGSDTFLRLLWKPSSVPSTASTHNFQMWSTTARYNMAAVDLVVTYEFNASTTVSNGRMNVSIVLPIEIASPLGYNVSADASRFIRSIMCAESNPTLLHSAFRINFNAATSVAGLSFRAGAQSYRAYTHVANIVAGAFCLQQRIDSGGAQGAGFTLAHGFNEIVIDGYSTDTTDDVTNIGGTITLNYQCDVPSQGLGAAAHTVRKVLLAWDAALTDLVRINNWSFSIPPANYWIVGAGFLFHQWSSASMAVTLDVQANSGEGKGAGYYDIYADAMQSDAERAYTPVWMRGRDVFKRFPTDVDPDRLNIETARDYRLFTSTTTGNGLIAAITYHSITRTFSGTVSGYADADGAGLTVLIFRTDTMELIGEVTTTAGGAYTFTWYDDTVGLLPVCVEDSTHHGAGPITTAV